MLEVFILDTKGSEMYVLKETYREDIDTEESTDASEEKRGRSLTPNVRCDHFFDTTKVPVFERDNVRVVVSRILVPVCGDTSE